MLYSTEESLAFFDFSRSIKLPNNQYGTTKVIKKIMSQNPMVSILKKAKNPKYWSNSNISSNSDTKIKKLKGIRNRFKKKIVNKFH